MATSSAPPHLHYTGVLEQLQSNEEAAIALMEGLTDTQLNWQPLEGKAWSVAQCVEHLVMANDQYLDALMPAIERSSAGKAAKLAPGIFGRIFLRALEPPVKGRVPAPKSLKPPSDLDRVTVIRRFRESHSEIRQAIASLHGKNANRVKFRSPFARLIRIKAATALLIIAAHERRHLWQARNVRTAAESQR